MLNLAQFFYQEQPAIFAGKRFQIWRVCKDPSVDVSELPVSAEIQSAEISELVEDPRCEVGDAVAPGERKSDQPFCVKILLLKFWQFKSPQRQDLQPPDMPERCTDDGSVTDKEIFNTGTDTNFERRTSSDLISFPSNLISLSE